MNATHSASVSTSFTAAFLRIVLPRIVSMKGQKSTYMLNMIISTIDSK
jgi:hypothetical protein